MLQNEHLRQPPAMAVFEVMVKCEGCGRNCRATISDGMNSPTLRCSACGHTLLEARAIKGYVYLLSNPRMPGLLKIGCTSRPVNERVQELNGATGVPEPFVVDAYFESSSPEQHEAQIHRRLAAQRVKGKEFFEVDLASALRVVQEVVESKAICDRSPSGLNHGQASSQVGRWSCGLCKHQWTAVIGTRCPLCQSTSVVRLGSL